MRFERVAFDHPDAVTLREQMVAEVSALYPMGRAEESRDGGLKVDPATVVMTGVGYDDDEPVAHVAVRLIDAGHEIKRMYVRPDHRGHGWSSLLLQAAETAVREAGATRLILHTGVRQQAAIGLYEARGFTPIDVYPPYLDVPESLCFAKDLVTGEEVT